MSRGYGQIQWAALSLMWRALKESMAMDDPGPLDGSLSPYRIAWFAYGHHRANMTTFPTESQVRSVRRALLTLQRDGSVVRVAHGRYTLGSQMIREFTVAAQFAKMKDEWEKEKSDG